MLHILLCLISLSSLFPAQGIPFEMLKDIDIKRFELQRLLLSELRGNRIRNRRRLLSLYCLLLSGIEIHNLHIDESGICCLNMYATGFPIKDARLLKY